MKTNFPEQSPRERLLQTASRLFYEHGVAHVGINEVIREAGIARMTLYNHFSSKDDLVREVLKIRVRQWEKSFVQEVETLAVSPRDRLLAVFDVLERNFSKPDFRGCTALNFTSHSSKQNNGLVEIAQEHKAYVLKYLEKLAHELPSRHPEELAKGLLLIQNGATVLAQLGGDTYHPGDAKRAATAFIHAYEDDRQSRQRGLLHE